MMEYALFPSAAKGAIAFVSPGHIETPCNRLHLRQFSGWWGIVQSGRDADEKRRWLRNTGHKLGAKGAIPLRMSGQPSGYRLCQRHLKIETRLVTAEDRKAKALCSCRNVAMFEFYRAATFCELSLENPVLQGLVVRATGKLVAQHGKIGRDDRVIFLICPIPCAHARQATQRTGICHPKKMRCGLLLCLHPPKLSASTHG